MYSGPVSIQVNGGRQGDPRLPFLINRGRVLLGPMLRHSEARGSLGVQKDRYIMDDGSYAEAIATPYVNIIAINLVTVVPEEEELEEGERFEYPVSFCSSEGASVTEAGTPWWHYRPAYGPVDVVTGDRAVSWASNKTGKLADYPCGNMTWFPAIPAEAPEGAEPLACLSWLGPPQRTFSHLQEEIFVPEEDTFLWLSFYDKTIPIVKMETPVPVNGAYLHTDQDTGAKVISILTLEGATENKSLTCRRYIENVWEQVWTVPLDARVFTHKTHAMVNPAGTEARFLCLEQRPENDTITDSQGNRWSTEFLVAHIEVVADLVAGTVSLGWEDIAEEYPYYVTRLEDEFDEVALPNGNKQFRLTTAVTPGETVFATVEYAGRTGYPAGARRQMPYIGEQYEFGTGNDFYVIEITNVTPVDSIPTGVQDETDPVVIDAMPVEDAEQVVADTRQGTVEQGPPYRGDYHGVSADIEFIYIYTPITDPPLITGAGSIYRNLNQSGVCKYRWRRKVKRYSTGRSICAVDYDADGTVVKAFLRVREKNANYMHDACGIGLGIIPETFKLSLPMFPDETGEEPEDTYPPDDENPTGRDHEYQRFSSQHSRTWAYVDIEGGTHDGETHPVLAVGYVTHSSWIATGYNPPLGTSQRGEDRYNYYSSSFTGWTPTYYQQQFYPGEEGGTQHEATNTYDSFDQVHNNTRGTVYIAHLDLRDGTLLLDYAGNTSYAQRNENDQVIGAPTNGEPESISGAVDPPGLLNINFRGFNALAQASRDDGVRQEQVRVGLIRRHALYHPASTGLEGVPVVSPLVDEAGAAFNVMAMFGYRGFLPATGGFTQSAAVGTSCHASQSGQKVTHEYSEAPLLLGIIKSGNGLYGTAALDDRRARVGAMRGEWMDWTAVGEGGINGSTQLLYGDEYELLYRYDESGVVRQGREEWSDVYGELPEDEQEKQAALDEFRSHDVWYGSKPQIKVE